MIQTAQKSQAAEELLLALSYTVVSNVIYASGYTSKWFPLCTR